MTAPERFADSQIPLAPRASSIHEPIRQCPALLPQLLVRGQHVLVLEVLYDHEKHFEFRHPLINYVPALAVTGRAATTCGSP